MMNGEGPSVPITTLAGIQSLNDLLLELPLPSPLPGAIGNRSLLGHSRDAEEAQRLLSNPDSYILPQLLDALNRTSVDHVEVNDGYHGGPPPPGQGSKLLQCIVNRNPNLFKGALQAQHSQWVHPQYTAPYSQPAAAYSPSQLCSPHPNSPQFVPQGSPGFFPMDPTQSGRLIQQKSPHSLFQFPQPQQQQQQQPQHVQIHPNATIPLPTPDHSVAGILDGQQYSSSPAVNSYSTPLSTPSQTPVVHSYANGNCAESTVSSVKRTENTPERQQAVVNTNSSSVNLIPPGNTSSSSPVQPPNAQVLNKSLPLSSLSPTDVQKRTTRHSAGGQHTPSTSSSQPPIPNKGNINATIHTDCTVVLTDISGSIKRGEIPVPSGIISVGNETVVNNVDDPDKRRSRRSIAAESPLKNKVSPEKHTSKSPAKTPSNDRRGNKSLPGTRDGVKRHCSESEDQDITPPKKRFKETERRTKNKELDKSFKKHSNQYEDDDDFKATTLDKYASSLSERVKNRRRTNQKAKYKESPSQSRGDDSDHSVFEMEESPAMQAFREKKPKIKKQKKEPPPEPMTAEDLMESNTYQRFTRTVEAIFDNMEDVDLTAELDEDAECPAEALIPTNLLKDLTSESAKLKILQATNQVPPERLVRLLNILERNVIDGAKLSPVQNFSDDQDDDESRLWLEVTMERIMRSADSSLTSLYVMTSPNMPEKVFLEDVIERIVIFVKFQLLNTVYPVFDPAYKVDSRIKDGYLGNIKQKRAHAHKVRERSIIQLYNKLHELVGLLAELLEIQTLTDTIILQVSTLGVSPFFVEGVSELQLHALRLVTTVFARYDKHRQLILEDILASIARLPTSKRSLRNYRLTSEEYIQMLTALVLQLIHSVVRLPDPEPEDENEKLINQPKETKEGTKEGGGLVDKDVLIITSYESAVRTALNFLSVFLKKCGTKNEEMDYRPLFENFVQDLLTTVNRPEWPASELLLSLLGRLLVQNFSNKSLDMTLRVASLDYLGVVAARLRRDAVTSQIKKETISDILKQIEEDEEDDQPLTVLSKSKKIKQKRKPAKKDETQILQRALLHYLDWNLENDPSLQFSRQFYIAQWYRDAAAEAKVDKAKEKEKEKPKEEESVSTTPKKQLPGRSSKIKGKRNCEIEDEEEEDEKPKEENDEVNAHLLALVEDRKRFLVGMVRPSVEPQTNIKQEHGTLDYRTAELISRFLASRRPFSQSFDIYLSQILRVLSESAVAVRTKAMKCLTLVVEADPAILGRPDMQRGVHGRLLDHSTSVREAAVDLVGKFILVRPELTHKYYDMLTERILDTGVSVRKRVIKILKDVCLEQPDFEKIPEICVKIIRRVNDEDGIKKLVGEVFQSMWFTPVPDKDSERLLQKVRNITHVVAACKDIGLEWFEQLLTNLMKNKEDNNYKPTLKSCRQIVDCLVENVLDIEESSTNDGGASQHLVACFTTLFMFAKIQPLLVVKHGTTIQPYLSMKCNTQADYLVLQNVTRCLELVVPLIEHPSETFLARIEEDLIKLILRQGILILPSSVSCLGAVINRVTRNYQLVRDCFHKFFTLLTCFKKQHEKDPESEALSKQKPRLLRSLYTVGLICRYFDFDHLEYAQDNNCQEPLKNKVFDVMIYFTHNEDEDIRHKSLTGIGFLMIRHFDLMLGPEVRELYRYLLGSPGSAANMKCQVLKNLTAYLLEEEAKMIQKDAEWSKNSKEENLKEMGDVSSGMASTVVQVYLKNILESVLSGSVHVRRSALHVIQLVLNQGLVHPVQMVPYLVCMGADNEQAVRTKADQLLQELEKKYPGFAQMKALAGVRLSYKMQQLIEFEDGGIIRGFRMADHPVSRNGFLYSILRTTRQSRRAFLLSLLKLFDEQAKIPLSELLYIADNIVYFPYQVQDEPLFVMHHIDILLSVSGSNLLQSFREALLPKQQHPPQETDNQPKQDDDDDDEDDYDALLQRLPEDLTQLRDCIYGSQACMLLLFVKQALKEMYGITDGKIQQYSPNEAAKVYEKTLNRKTGVTFKPVSIIETLKFVEIPGTLDLKGRQKLIQQYVSFKQLMLTIDPDDDDDDEEGGNKVKHSTAAAIAAAAATQMAMDPAAMAAAAGNPAENSSELGVAGGGCSANLGEPAPLVTPDKSVIANKLKLPSHRIRTKSKSVKSATKEKVKKKHRKKRKRVISSDGSSEGEDSDPSYCE